MEINTKVTPAKYLVKMIVKSEIGFVKSNSMVPVLRSSENERMVMAGMRIKKIIGLIPKNDRKSAVPPSKIFVS